MQDQINAKPKNDCTDIPVIIPSFKPDDRLKDLCRDLFTAGISHVVILDDGSGPEYRPIFDEIQQNYPVTLLRHAVNMGKGRALKTAFNEVLNMSPAVTGCITADSDGQHTPTDIHRCMQELRSHPDSLILGCRNFDGDQVPRKSRMGNLTTRAVFRFLCGVKVSDTQTGLRGIPRSFMEELMNVPGERFDFETRMLLECKDHVPIIEVPIETVYDSRDNHQTHYNALRDSLRITAIFGRIVLKYALSSLLSCALDLFLFFLLCRVFAPWSRLWYVTAATIIARIGSATFNYFVNYRYVFKSRRSYQSSAAKYLLLAAAQMGMSALLVTILVLNHPGTSETLFKIIVDSILFIISYLVQMNLIF